MRTTSHAVQRRMTSTLQSMTYTKKHKQDKTIHASKQTSVSNHKDNNVVSSTAERGNATSNRRKKCNPKKRQTFSKLSQLKQARRLRKQAKEEKKLIDQSHEIKKKKIIPKAAFVREVTQIFDKLRNEGTICRTMRPRTGAIDALYTGAENYLHVEFHRSNLIAAVGGRTTVEPSDMQLSQRMRTDPTLQ